MVKLWNYSICSNILVIVLCCLQGSLVLQYFNNTYLHMNSEILFEDELEITEHPIARARRQDSTNLQGSTNWISG